MSATQDQIADLLELGVPPSHVARRLRVDAETVYAIHARQMMRRRGLQPLPAFCNPTPGDYPTASTRDVWCRHADTRRNADGELVMGCLDIAILERWPALSCERCPRRGLDQEDREAVASGIGWRPSATDLAGGAYGSIGASAEVSRRLSEYLRSRGAPTARDLRAGECAAVKRRARNG